MTTYTKLSSSIIQSSLWNESPEIRCVWITMLALADKDGYVAGDVRTISRLANIGIDETQAALDLFAAPDPGSRSQEHEGRRIVSAAGGFTLLNHSKYRELGMSEDVKAYWREKKAKTSEKIPRKFSETSVSVSVVVPEKGCGEEGKKQDALPFASGSFQTAWSDWKAYRSQRRSKLTPATIQKQLALLQTFGETAAILSINRSIENGWLGLFPVDGKPSAGKPLRGESKELQIGRAHV